MLNLNCKPVSTRYLQRLVRLQLKLELIRSYLYIEKERFGDRLSVRWEGPPVHE